MSADPPEDPSLSKNDLDLLLNLIVTNNNADPNATSNQKEEFPKEYDYSQPAKSWWRYFSKQIETNTAVCYTCGATFNRGPKQSTTSLSHHLKMYHQAQFIFIQQAKDEDNRRNGKQSRPTKVPAKKVEPSEEIISKGKKSAFNLSLIKAVRQRPQIFDPQQRPKTEEEQVRIWRAVADEIGSGITPEIAKKRWLQVRDRYRKELKFAIRDNFSYEPKWPYFQQLDFMNEHLRDCPSNGQRSNSAESDYNLQTNVASTLFNNIFNATCIPISIDEEESTSIDSAIASTSEHSSPNNPDQSKQDSAFLAIRQLIEQTNEPPADEPPPAKRSRSRKAPPARVQQPTVTSSSSERFDWLNDEDMLFGKIVALRLRTLPVESKQQIKICIEELFERHERGLSMNVD